MTKRRKKPDPLIGWQEPEDRPEGRFLTEYDIADDMSMVRPMEPIEMLDRIVAIVFREMGDALARGDKIDLRDFGTFEIKTRSYLRHTRAVDPETGAFIPEPEVQIYFSAAKSLRRAIEEGAP